MDLYHGTTEENLDSILKEGLKPRQNWDSDNLSVISLTNSIENAFREAYIIDVTKISLGMKEKPADIYVVLRIKPQDYSVRQWQIDEWWIQTIVKPKDIEIVRKESCEVVRRKFIE